MTPWKAAALHLALLTGHAPAASPFEGLYQLDGIMTSKDEYGIWAYWPAAAYRLEYPGQHPLEGLPGMSPVPPVAVAVYCRADGRREGFDGPAPPSAELVLPLHPDERTMPLFFDPRFWLAAMFPGTAEETPVSVRLAGTPPFPSTLRHEWIDRSFPPPPLPAEPRRTVRLDPGALLRALARLAGSSTVITAEGPGTWLEIHLAPAVATASAAALMTEHCPPPAGH